MHPLTILIVLILTAITAAAGTRIQITGMETKSESQTLELLGARLEHVRNRPPSPSRADDAAFLLRQLLRNDGYSSVQVDWSIPSRDTITLAVREGPRFSLGTVNLSGTESSNTRRLTRLFGTPAEKNRPLGLGSPPFREGDIPKGLALLVQDHNARGHWLATADESDRKIDPATSRVTIDIEVTPGPVFTIGRATVHSPDGRGVIRTATTAEPFIGRPANTANLNSLRIAVEQAFFSRGYPDARILMTRELADDQFIPQFHIDLGTRVRLREINIAGLNQTSPERVERLFTRFPGEWYDQAAMHRKVRTLLASGAFSSVRLETNEVEPKRIDATLHFVETRAKEFSVAAGLGTYEGAIARFTYTDRNLYGQLRALNTGLEITSRGILGDVRITDPWFIGTDIAASARLYSLYRSNEGYTNFRTGIESSLTWSALENYQLEFLVGVALVETSEDGLSAADLGETSYSNPYLRITQSFDRRDNPVMPKTGWHVAMPLEAGMALGDESTSYFKGSIHGGWFYPLGEQYHLSAGGQFGMMIPSGDGTDLPIDLRFFNGGARSVRSFEERRLGPQGANGDPTGGEAYWATSVQLMRNLAGPLRLVTFLDAGALSREFDGLGDADLELAAGLGLRLELPIGPVRLEYGRNLTRDDGEPNGTFHFAIGAAF
jgi:outer membrane protein insertion porin family